MMKWCYHNDFISQYIWFECLKTLFNGVMRQCMSSCRAKKQTARKDRSTQLLEGYSEHS